MTSLRMCLTVFLAVFVLVNAEIDEEVESHTTQGPCPWTKFRCSNGSCIERQFVCDGNNTCGDWSDESDCNVTSFTSAPLSCPFGNLRCNNGRCVHTSIVCDGNNDCGDWSDEYGCNTSTVTTTERPICRLGKFQCWNGRCINFDWVCDGYDDCYDESDELRCGTSVSTASPGCRPGSFQCWNGHCIRFSWVCDGFDDCKDGSDEIRCSVNREIRVVERTNVGVMMGLTIGVSLLIIIFVIGVVCLKNRKSWVTAGTVIPSPISVPWSVTKSGLQASPAPYPATENSSAPHNGAHN